MTHVGNQTGNRLWNTSGGARSEPAAHGTVHGTANATSLAASLGNLQAKRDETGHTLRAVTRAIEVEIVPRLVMAHRDFAHGAPSSGPAAPAIPLESPASDAVAHFAEIILGQDNDRACAYVDGLHAQGLSLERIYLELLAPTANHLRFLWSTDVCDFSEITLALWRLQQVLREFSATFRSEFDHREHGLRVLLTPAPGERQELGYVMFGLVMIAEFFRREGWDAWIEPDTSSKEFSELIHEQSFDVVEFLASGDKRLDSLASGIRTVRRESSNKSIGVMVCGPAFNNNPELVLMVGADIMSSDPRQGAVQAQNLVGLLASRG